ncbi:hypothetical protein BDZ97DRAFT_1907180 [Flammula alnicola]|nr:hypothetical protein BDZ97DRAFT_1907180 [Flammula alnicola]
MHPPTHRNHTRSLFLTLFALRKFLSLPNLDATIGLRIGLNEPGIESEVGRAITKAHPSLRIYKPLITRLSARLALHQQNPKLAQNTLRKVLTNFIVPSDPPHITYSAHLAYITSLSGISQDDDSGPYSPSWANLKALGAIKDLHALAIRNKHREVAQLAMVLQLRDLVQNGFWTRVGETLEHNEEGLAISSELEASKNTANHQPLVIGKTNLEKVLIIHVLIIGVLYYTYVGDSAKSQWRIKKLHDMLDSGAMDAFGPSGIVVVKLPDSLPLRVHVTHPHVIFALGFLVSSVSKRDPVGRKPKRKLFANEGILVVDKELRKEVPLPLWASTVDVKGFYDRMHKLKADMICELVGHLAQLVAHTHTRPLVHLQALKCYQVAALLSRRRTTKKESESDEQDSCENQWFNVSAPAEEVWLRVGLASEFRDELLRKTGAEVIKECEGLGGTLQALGAVLAACLSKEFLVAKGHLHTPLNLSTSAQDNHLRAIIPALVATQYMHISTEFPHLAAGLGAQPKMAKNAELKKGAAKGSIAGSGGDGVGNAHLIQRLWIGERSLDEQGAFNQAATNE